MACGGDASETELAARPLKFLSRFHVHGGGGIPRFRPLWYKPFPFVIRGEREREFPRHDFW